jgi:hypothetical protein
MGITPITSLMPLSVARTLRSDLDPAPMERVQSSPRAGDETFSQSRQAATGSSDDDADSFSNSANADPSTTEDSAQEPPPFVSESQHAVSLFA